MSSRPPRHNYALRESSTLSVAELEVIQLIASGLTAKQVGLQRGTSERTVQMQLISSRSKTGCRTTPQLCVHAVVSGLVSYGRAAVAGDLGVEERV